MRKRLIEGYSMNVSIYFIRTHASKLIIINIKKCNKNILIVKEDRKLKELWSWMKIADQISAKMAKVGNTDYSFHGVYGIWIGSQGRNSKSSPANTPRINGSPKLARPPSSSRIKEDITPSDANNDPANDLPMVDTARAAQRHLALTACGFDFDVKGFERELVE